MIYQSPLISGHHLKEKGKEVTWFVQARFCQPEIKGSFEVEPWYSVLVLSRPGSYRPSSEPKRLLLKRPIKYVHQPCLCACTVDQ